MMLSVGVDMIEIERIRRAMQRHGDRFRRRFFTQQELAYCGDRIECLAGRYAVKEAVSKALGTGIGEVRWTEIEIVCDGRGKPELVLHHGAASLSATLGLREWSISLSHTEKLAIGFAVGRG